jgi:hypothetical protein
MHYTQIATIDQICQATQWEIASGRWQYIDFFDIYHRTSSLVAIQFHGMIRLSIQ